LIENKNFQLSYRAGSEESGCGRKRQKGKERKENGETHTRKRNQKRNKKEKKENKNVPSSPGKGKVIRLRIAALAYICVVEERHEAWWVTDFVKKQGEQQQDKGQEGNENK
jgi:hypothetical protein